MIGFGCSLKLNKFIEHVKKPKGIIIGFCCQYLIMPFISWLVSKLLELDDHLAVALIVVGCCPGGAISNILCYSLQMDIELSIAMTSASSIAAIGMMPLNCYFYLKAVNDIDFEFDWAGLIISCLVVVFGIIFGLYLNWKYTRYSFKIEKLARISMLGKFFFGQRFHTLMKNPVASL